jgi:mRNA interferase MazF
MAINYAPAQGSILICDFKGFQEPEMTKRRPVIVISPRMKDRWGLCSVVPLSTTAPRPVKGYHLKLQTTPLLPAPFLNEWHWVKADLIYAVSFNRLSLMFDDKGGDGKRIYDKRVVSPDNLKAIQQCVLCGLGLTMV